MSLIKNANIFTFEGITPESIDACVQRRVFAPLTQFDLVTRGFVPPVDGTESMVRRTQNIIEVCIREDQKVIPTSFVKEELKKEVEKFSAAHGFTPGKKTIRDIRNYVITEIAAKAIFKTKYIRAIFDFDQNILIIDQSSANKSQEIAQMILRHIGPDAVIKLWKTSTTPTTIFNQWILDHDMPYDLSVDDKALIKDYEGGTIRINKEDITREEIRMLIEKGRLCNELALTIDQVISFVLTNDLIVKKIDYLPIKDDSRVEMSEEELHDADTLISVHSIRQIFEIMNEAMGGLSKETNQEAA